MRALATVVGVSNRVQGVKKETGKAYDFHSIAINYDAPRMNGYAAATMIVDTEVVNSIGGIAPGDLLDLFYHEFKGKFILDGIVNKVRQD